MLKPGKLEDLKPGVFIQVSHSPPLRMEYEVLGVSSCTPYERGKYKITLKRSGQCFTVYDEALTFASGWCIDSSEQLLL